VCVCVCVFVYLKLRLGTRSLDLLAAGEQVVGLISGWGAGRWTYCLLAPMISLVRKRHVERTRCFVGVLLYTHDKVLIVHTHTHTDTHTHTHTHTHTQREREREREREKHTLTHSTC
jgi:hypothetical protein